MLSNKFLHYQKNIINSSLKNFSCSIFVKDTKMIIKIINEIAPEHLELNVKKPEKFLKIDNAGSIFLGKYSPEAIGDYLAGPNLFTNIWIGQILLWFICF